MSVAEIVNSGHEKTSLKFRKPCSFQNGCDLLAFLLNYIVYKRYNKKQLEEFNTNAGGYHATRIIPYGRQPGISGTAASMCWTGGNRTK